MESIQLPPDESDESEIETDYKCPNYSPIKRKRLIATTKPKNLLEKYSKTVNIKPSNYELQPKMRQRKIQINCPKVLRTPAEGIQIKSHAQNESSEEIFEILTDQEIFENKLPPEQLTIYPIFQSYETGPKSNRLYIKNLSKTVTILNLKSIFHRYIQKTEEEIEIKHFTTGKMNGQAFVKFPDVAISERALRETHGFLLKNKPMYVQYARGNKSS